MSDELKQQAKELDPVQVYNEAPQDGEIVKKGGGVWVHCPFPDHPDAKPSCKLDTDEKGEGVFYCYKCKKGGDNIMLASLLLYGSPEEHFQDILRWTKDHFSVTGKIGYSRDPLDIFAGHREYRSKESLRTYPVQTEEHGHILSFCLQLEWHGEVVGERKRQTDDAPLMYEDKDNPIRSKMKSGGTANAFFLPSGLTGDEKPDPESIPVICEGETDAIAATDVARDIYGIGVPKPSWRGEITDKLKRVLDHFETRPVIVPDGDISRQDVAKAAEPINARIIQVPPSVHIHSKQRDLNEWLKADRSDLKACLLGKEGFTPLRNDAESQVVELVKERAQGANNPAKAKHEAAIRNIVSWVLKKVLPYTTRKIGSFTVNPGQWKLTVSELETITGQSRSTVHTIIDQLETAGFWKIVQKRRGSGGGILIEVPDLFYWRRS